jgi:hypothetical protein
VGRIGTSTLTFDAAFDDAGTTGLVLDLRPMGVRYQVVDQLAIALDPLALTVVEPTFSAPDHPFVESSIGRRSG